MAWTLAQEGEQAVRRLADRFGDVPDVQDTLVRSGRASLLPKEKTVEAIRRILSQPEWEYFNEILIRQSLELDGDVALAELSQNKSAAVRAWARLRLVRTPTLCVLKPAFNIERMRLYAKGGLSHE